MNLDLIAEKLNKLQNKGKGERIDYDAIQFKPSIGKQEVRIVPSAYNPDNPFTAIKVYYGIGSKRVMISPLNFGEVDPIKEFTDKLTAEFNTENYAIARKLFPKTRYYAPVVVRGEEDKGVRLWSFGKQIYEMLLSFAMDEDVGDYTDIKNGRDIKLETVGPDVTGTKYNKTSIMYKVKTTPLSKNKDEVELWTTEQPNPMETFKKYSYEEMKKSLEEWLTPEDDEDDDTDDGLYNNSSKEKPAKVKNEWDDMFKDDK